MKPKRSTAKRAAPKKRATKRRTAAKPRKSAKQRVAPAKKHKPAKKSVAPKRAHAKKRTAAKRTTPRRAVRVITPPAFPQMASATDKQRLLFEMLRGRAALMAALQGLMGGSVEQPLAARQWTVRETVLHMCAWDAMALRAIEPAIRGIAPEWAAARGATLDKLNARGVDALRHQPWDEALRLLQLGRQRLIESVEDIPDEPAVVWAKEHALGAMLIDLASNDRHHAEIIKRWRS
jgi:hypothetical protein